MSIDNSTTVAGNLTEKPVLNSTKKNEIPVSNFSVAVNRTNTIQTDHGPKEVDEVVFFEVTASRHLATNITNSFKKGDRVVVIGRMKTETWITGDIERSKLVIVADDVAGSALFHKVKMTKPKTSEADDSYKLSAAPTSPSGRV